jgi:hypothetical protein
VVDPPETENSLSVEPYAYGTECTWHGPLTFAADITNYSDDSPQHACPKCCGAVTVTNTEEFWRLAQASDRDNPGHEAMLRWSAGKCFEDFDTMQNAYRQAMEGTL